MKMGEKRCEDIKYCEKCPFFSRQEVCLNFKLSQTLNEGFEIHKDKFNDKEIQKIQERLNQEA